MRLSLDIKPRKYKAATKQELLHKIGMTSFSTGTYGDVHHTTLSSYDMSHMKVYTCQKFRPKFKQTKKSDGVTKSKKIREGYWEAHMYHIPTSFLDAAGLKVVQDRRTFKLVKRK